MCPLAATFHTLSKNNVWHDRGTPWGWQPVQVQPMQQEGEASSMSSRLIMMYSYYTPLLQWLIGVALNRIGWHFEEGLLEEAAEYSRVRSQPLSTRLQHFPNSMFPCIELNDTSHCNLSDFIRRNWIRVWNSQESWTWSRTWRKASACKKTITLSCLCIYLYHTSALSHKISDGASEELIKQRELKVYKQKVDDD